MPTEWTVALLVVAAACALALLAIDLTRERCPRCGSRRTLACGWEPGRLYCERCCRFFTHKTRRD